MNPVVTGSTGSLAGAAELTGRAMRVDPETYERHPLHAADRTWTEINCYIDLWIEVLHALGLDPRPASVCALSADFLDDQWSFIKHEPEDIRLLYGIEIGEINVWRTVPEHLLEHLSAGRLLTVEMDSWWLPDTAGVSYRRLHDKSTVVPVALDVAARTMTYFHNAGLFQLEGEDFDGVFSAQTLVPYVEAVRLDRLRAGEDLVPDALRLTGAHLARRPEVNPVTRMGARLEADLPGLAGKDLDAFHVYTFGMLRQCGGTAALAADLAVWFGEQGLPGLDDVAAQFAQVADLSKSAQFQMARLARGRSGSLTDTLDQMAQCWQRAIDGFVAWHER